MSIEEVRNKEVHTERVKRSVKKSVLVTSFQRTSPEEFGSSYEKNHFSKMTTFKQWNYGSVPRGILPSIKKGIISCEKTACLSFNYSFSHHAQARLMYNDMLTKNIYFFRELATVVEDLYHFLCLNCFGSQSPYKEASSTCWDFVTTLLVFLFDELRDVKVVAEDAFNHIARSNKIYLWGVLQSYPVMAEFVKDNFTVNPKFHPQMIMFILEMMVPWVDLECVSVAYANVSALPMTVQNIASSLDDFYSRLHDLEATNGLEVGRGAPLSRNARRNQNRSNGADGGNSGSGIGNIS